VLVKQPYFCEPSFERMRGTEEGNLNSKLYNERAYVMARGFVRHALEASPAGLSDEIHWLYYTRGKLAKVIRDSSSLIASSQQFQDAPLTTSSVGYENERAILRLTLGGILPLQRTLLHLQALLSSDHPL